MNIVRSIATACLISFAMLAGANTAAACTLSLGWEPYEPFQFKDSSGTVTGIDVEAFRAVAKEIGCTVVTKERPWKRLERDLKLGETDAAMGLQVTPERAAIGYFSDDYRNDDMVLFVRKGELKRVGADGLPSLKGKDFIIGIVPGYEYGPVFDRLMTDPAFAKQIYEASSTILNLRMLARHRIDGLIENSFVGMAMARREKLADVIERHPVAVQSANAKFMFSRKSVSPQTVKAFNAALARMKTDGSLDAILNRYMM